MSKISFERLHLLLGNTGVLELFLGQLLSHPVTLCRPPEVALPWYNTHCVPDIRAAGVDCSIYCVFIGPCGMGDLMREMQQDARHGEGVPQELHIIMFCQEEPFGIGQNYYKIGPAILNSSSVIPVVGGNIYYHVLVASPATLFPAAPGEVQQLLEVLGGREPDSTPLLQAMSQVEVRWMWMDNLRRHRKESFARGYADAISAGLNIFSAAEVGMKCEEVYEEGYVEEKLEQINNVPHRIQAELSIEAIANSLEVPVEVVKGVLEGKVYTEEDFRKMYGRGK